MIFFRMVKTTTGMFLTQTMRGTIIHHLLPPQVRLTSILPMAGWGQTPDTQQRTETPTSVPQSALNFHLPQGLHQPHHPRLIVPCGMELPPKYRGCLRLQRRSTSRHSRRPLREEHWRLTYNTSSNHVNVLVNVTNSSALFADVVK